MTTQRTWPEVIKAAKERTGRRIAVAVKRESYQVQDVTYDARGKATVVALGPFESVASAVVRLDRLGVA